MELMSGNEAIAQGAWEAGEMCIRDSTYTPPATSKHVDSFEVPETKKTA